MIIITGAYGFIGSVLTHFLLEQGHQNLLLVDDFSKKEKSNNLESCSNLKRVERKVFIEWLANTTEQIEFVFHLGARTDTTEFDYEILKELNLNYTKAIWNICTQRQIPLLYASSAATYGDGALGYEDTHDFVNDFKPLNPYGDSKNEFDKWALNQEQMPPFWSGMKFFNVYGPNEFHKGRMASVVFHFFNQIRQKESVNLFKSHRADYGHGEQRRDFIYVKDVVNMLHYFYQNTDKIENGLYNIGTGKARSFNELTKAIFKVLDIKANINYVDTPIDIRDKYQYFTEATLEKLKNTGCPMAQYSLEDGIADYVNHYLLPNKNYS